MIDKISQVYNLLEDEQSKDIFLNRLLYNVTNEEKYCKKMFEYQLEYLKKNENSRRFIKEFYDLIGGRDVVIYGIGDVGKNLYHNINMFAPEIKVVAFCDKKWESMQQFFRCPVSGKNELCKSYKDCLILVSPLHYQNEIRDELLLAGVKEENIILFEKILNFATLQAYGQYFDEIVSYKDDEIFVDGGALYGETSFEFIKRCKDYKEIILFEPDLNNYKECKKNFCDKYNTQDNGISFYNYGLWNKTQMLSFESNRSASKISENGEYKIEVRALDDILDDKAVTFIKLDIEGAEMKALEGAKEIIRKYKPKMAICIYHRINDIVEIPLYIKDLSDEYRFYIRHYQLGAGETVLYAIPDKKNNYIY